MASSLDLKLSFAFRVFREQWFLRVVPAKHLYIPILTNETRSCQTSWRTRAGLSFPYRTGTCFPSCAHRCEDLLPSRHPNLRMWEPFAAKPCLEASPAFAWVSIGVVSCLVTLTKCDRSLWKSERTRTEVDKMEPRCHGVTRRAGRQKVTTEPSGLQSLSNIHLPKDTRQLTSPQGEADVRSLEGLWRCRRWGKVNSLAVETAYYGSPPLLEVRRTHAHLFAYKHIWPTIMFTKLSLAGWPFMFVSVLA